MCPLDLVRIPHDHPALDAVAARCMEGGVEGESHDLHEIATPLGAGGEKGSHIAAQHSEIHVRQVTENMNHDPRQNRARSPGQCAVEHGRDEKTRAQQQHCTDSMRDVCGNKHRTGDPDRIVTVVPLDAGLHVPAERHLLYHACGDAAHEEHRPAIDCRGISSEVW